MGGAKERGCREDGERERVCSHSEREKRYKGREANLKEKQTQSWRQVGRQVFGQRCQATGTGENPMVIALSLREGGWGRLMTAALSMRVSDRWRYSAKKCVCVQERGCFPTPEVANACTSLACYVASQVHCCMCISVHDCMRFKGKMRGKWWVIQMFCTQKISCFAFIFWFFMFCLNRTSWSVRDLQFASVTTWDREGLKRTVLITGNSWENQTVKDVACILDTKIHGGSNGNISDQGKVGCIIQHWFQAPRWWCKLWQITGCCSFEMVDKASFGMFSYSLLDWI